MCGIAGILERAGGSPNAAQVQAMIARQRHRGPDDEGCFVEGPVGLGHARLAILDLTEAGRQPMSSAGGALWITYNGEVYNYLELRDELAARGHVFRTRTDTEVILAAYREWQEDCFARFNGMWALAIWDRSRQRLICSRDRFGVKPFYYYADDRRFVFASEIKALLTGSTIPRLPNYPRLYEYLAYWQLDHTDESCFQGVRQLPAGHVLSVDAGALRLRSYYNLNPQSAIPRRPRAKPRGNPQSPAREERQRRFLSLFEDAVRLRLRSDVPVGTCLSGGLDSTSIVCVCRRLLDGDPESKSVPSKSFSVYYDTPELDERPYIDAVVKAARVDGHLIQVRPDDLPGEVIRFLWHQEEPVGGLGVFAQWQVMKLARSCGVKVLLDGQGGDELFAGYDSFLPAWLADHTRRFRWGTLWRSLSVLRSRLGGLSPSLLKATLAEVLPESTRRQMARYRRPPIWIHPQFAAAHGHALTACEAGGTSRLEQRLREAILRRSLPVLLRYEDRNSMAHSIETRAPFLDVRLVEFACSLPVDDKIDAGVTKAVVRRAMRGLVPDLILDRKDKMGFVAPEARWIRGGLHDMVGDVIGSSRFRQRGIFDTSVLLQQLARHRAGQGDYSQSLWCALNTELWLQQFVDK